MLVSRLGWSWKNASFLRLFYKFWSVEAEARVYPPRAPRVGPFLSRVLAPGPRGGRVLL
jgi:hypothetical protein